MKPITFEPVIGLEIHVQLRTQSKMFCRCANSSDEREPNTTVCPICLGHPGTLPVPNRQAIDWAVLCGMALNCKIAKHSKFDRKSYFYPDLPKGYQISQYDQPVATNGHILISTGGAEHRIRIERVHVEEDSAKLIHSSDGSGTLIDFNRAGTPLIEIVTKPDLSTPALAKTFLQELRLIIRYLGISDADMEKGHLRCDANVSLKPVPEDFDRAKAELGLEGDITTLFPQTEVKNLNSFRSIERALEYEIVRQTKLWNEGSPPTESSTRGWDERLLKTVEHREKEAVHDYRYMPEPDIPPLVFDQSYLDRIRREIPELPAERRKRFMSEYGMKFEDASRITDDVGNAKFAEEVLTELQAWIRSNPEMDEKEKEAKVRTLLSRHAVSWITNKLFGILNARKIDISQAQVTPENFAELITLMYQGRMNATTGYGVLREMLDTGKDPSDILEEHGLGAMDNAEELADIVGGVITEHPDMVDEYKKGKTGVLQFFIGQAMKKTKGKADPKTITELLKKQLG